MGQEIIDLDELLPPDIKVRLGGTVYTLPGDIPVELYLRINAIDEDSDAEAEVVQDLRDRILDLFRIHQPDMDSLPMALTQLVQAVGKIYGPGSAEGNGRKGSTRSTPRPRARSRSST